MRSERGLSMSVVVVSCVPAFVLMLGLVVDGGSQLASAQRAEVAAQTAARVAANAAAPDRVAGRVSPGAAVAAAQQSLSGSGVTGSAEVVGGDIQVRAVASRPTVFLSIIGVNSVSGSGYAEASLLSSDAAE